MILDIVVLILSVFIGAFLAWNSTTRKFLPFKIILTFAGAYLFSVTLLHIVPELFTMGEHAGVELSPHLLGAAMLVGFFIQKILEYFSQGVEHGHMHSHGHHFSPIILTIALCIHSFFEGTVLSPEFEHMGHAHSHGSSLLLGILMHKLPAAFVLFVVLQEAKVPIKKIYMYMTMFAISSPVGLLFNHFIVDQTILGGTAFLLLYGIVAGSFLDISTTIFIESSPEHKVHKTKLLAILAGVFFAALTQLI